MDKIFQNGLITLTFFPNTDILVVSWTNQQLLTTSEVQVSMHKVIEAINKNQNQNLVIDASHSIAIMDDFSFKSSLAGFLDELSRTSIKKVARVYTPYPAREEKIDCLQNELSFLYQIQDFSNREEAFKWLASRKQ